LYLGLAGTWLLLGYLVAITGNRGGTVGFNVGVAWWAYGATQFRAIVHYLWLSLWPHPLVLDYGTDWIRRAAEIVPYALLVVPLAAAALLALQRRTVPGFIGASFFAILAPTSLVPGTIQMIVEHRMYLPLAAVLALLVPGIYLLIGRRCLVLFAVLAIGLGALTARRNEDYRSAVAIWNDTVAKRPDSARAHGNLGYALAQAGRVPEAIVQHEATLRLKPDDAKAHFNLGSELLQMNRYPEAIGHFEEALRIKPDFDAAQVNWGNALEKSGHVPEAIAHYEAALRTKPNDAGAHLNLGIALAQMGRLEEAIEHYQAALRINPGSAETYNDLGTALARTGRVDEAIQRFEEALQLRPDYAGAHYNLGFALFKAGRTAEAIEHDQAALQINPRDADTHCNLGDALLQAGRVTEAAAQYEEALRIQPDSEKARARLARLQACQPTVPRVN
jgi:tetratricopeptide (TPR) repeat protein